ncbi:MAG: DUF5667 domain-containing protein [Candidatus Nealsonbacteria bacterium]|nr:DUF5667 domain-containing protein [Candidatus Nealsonbacteria bacterium]
MRSDIQLIKKITELKAIKPRNEWVILMKKNILAGEPNAQLIKKIVGLKAIKPREEWVVLTKKNVLGWEPKFGLSFIFKPAFASLVVICMLGGIGVFAKSSLPGDLLYPVKRVGEKVVVSLMPEKSRSNIQLTIANDKLENIVKAVETNQPKKIIPIVKEYQANVSEAAQNLKKVAKADIKDIKEIVQTNQTLEENKKKIEEVYGVLLGDNKDLNEEIDREMNDLVETFNNATFSQSQQAILDQLKEDLKNKNYPEVFDKIELLLQALPSNQEK